MKIFFALFAALLLLGCSTQEPIPVDRVLRYGIPQAPTSLDPAAAGDLVYYQIAFNILETLIAVDWKSSEFLPVLAMAWRGDSLGLHWTFSLRRGIFFHDGSPLNAEAVKISFERQFDPHSPYYWPQLTDTQGHVAFSMLKEIRTPNDSTVQFILKYPYSAFLDNLATPYFATIVSPRALKEFGESFGHQPVGTGPFQFVKWEPDREIVIKKFPQYWGKKAQLDGVSYQIMQSLDDKIQALQQGQLDVISGVSAASVDKLYRLQGIKVVEEPLSLATVILGMKCQSYPFSKIEVRRAIARGIDKEKIVIRSSRGLAVVAKGPLSPMLMYYDSTLASLGYDSIAAKELLQNAGYENDFPISLNHCVDTDSLRDNPLVQAIKSDLEKIGFPIHVAAYHDWSNYEVDILEGNKGHMFFMGWMSYTRHPDYILYSLFQSQSPNNYFNYKNPEVDRLLEQARQTLDSEQQRQLYRRVQEIILEDAPAVFISHPKVVYVRSERVKNFKANPLYIPVLNEVSLDDTK
ncbi:ABC transporter substrate-binding protein [candidate division KSB1 bacterium]|nr:ABC transporter substrate-binding protein [candidate division KSB1 bacterium]